LYGFGGILFVEYKLAIFLAAILLLVSMLGAIVMTLYNISFMTLKVQDENLQAIYL